MQLQGEIVHGPILQQRPQAPGLEYRLTVVAMAQVLNVKGIRSQLHPTQSEALWSLGHLEELVLDCDQPPEAEEGAVVAQQTSNSWGLPEFPDGMLRLRNLTHLTLSCHYALTSLPSTITKLNKLQVAILFACRTTA